LTRVNEDSSGSVEVNDLYDAYKFEMEECGNKNIASKRVLVDHIIKIYPNVEKKRIQMSRKSTLTQYTGIIKVPVDMNIHENVNIVKVKDILTNSGDDIKIIEEKSNIVKCCIDTLCKSNGNCILKVITFMDTGEWRLDISDQNVNLNQIMIANTYQSDTKGIKTVLTAARKVNLCEGVPVSKNVIMTRFHILENWRSGESSKRILRSKLCSRVITFNALNSTCIKCQKMTLIHENNEDKENSNNSNTKPLPNVNNTVQTPQQSTNNCVKEDIKKLIPCATDEMVELILSQANNVCKDPRGRRWTEGMINVCLQWYCKSPQAYENFRASKYLVLPSKSTLIQYKNRIKQHTGFDNNIFDWMFEEAKRRSIPEEGYTGGIIIDEMSIQSDIQICKNNDVIELAGFMDVGEEGNICHTMRKGKNEKVLGTHALQFVFLGINGFRFPFAHFISDNVQAPELYPLFWEAVDRLSQFGFKAVYTCMDGAQSNRTFMHINTSAEKNFTCNCPCTFGQMIFIMDCKHVIKKIRNNVLKSGIFKTSTRLLTLPNSDSVQWQMFTDCYKWDKLNAFQLHRKLTNDHIYPTNQLKMRNHLAEDVLDTDMLHLMLQYQNSLGAKGSVLNGTIEFLRHTSKLIQIFKDMRALKSLDDPRLEELLKVAKWFEDWKVNSLSNTSIPPKDRQRQILSAQCHEDIQACIIGFYQLAKQLLSKATKIYITPGLINSDVIENTFNQQRSTYHGANSNPYAQQYRQALNSIVLGQTTVSQKANAGKNRSAAIPYNCTLSKQLPAQKRKSEHNDYVKIKVIRK
jgi:hypothetical protein